MRRAFLAAKLALGERMYAAGIDDGHLRAQIAAVDQTIRQAEAAGVSPVEMLPKRRELLLRLAAAALQDDAPLPGADAEYERARQAQAALQQAVEGRAVKGRVVPLAGGIR